MNSTIQAEAQPIPVTKSFCHNFLCWGSVIGGVFVAFVLGLMLNLLSTGLGFAMFSPDADVIKSLGMSAIVWVVVSGVVSMFFGGWVAGFFSGGDCPKRGFLHGFLVSALSLMLMLVATSTAVGALMGGTFSVIGKSLSATGSVLAQGSKAISGGAQGVANSVTNVTDLSSENIDAIQKALPDDLGKVFADLRNQATEMLKNVKNEAKDQAKDQIADKAPSAEDVKAKADEAKAKFNELKAKVEPALKNFIASLKNENYQQAKDDLVDMLTQVSGKNKDEVNAIVLKWQSTYEEAMVKAKAAVEDTANKTAGFISKFALINFFLLLISVLAAGVGGSFGSRKNCRV